MEAITRAKASPTHKRLTFLGFPLLRAIFTNKGTYTGFASKGR